MKVIILAGGGGSRLFPLSRKAYPKQFLSLEDERSLLAHTVERAQALVEPQDIVVVTNERYRYHVKNELEECQAGAAHVVLEPLARNTAPAVALAASYCETELGAGADEVLLVVSADHVIKPVSRFTACMERGVVVARDTEGGALVTFGVPATRPETGYGYIECGAGADDGSYAVASFREKPDAETAASYVAAGNYYWNLGMFAFRLDFLWRELAQYEPDIMTLISEGYQTALERFDEMPEISIDYALAERSHSVRMLPLDCYWSDIGSWDAVYDLLPKDEDGNATRGDCLTLDCHNSLVMGRDRLIAGIGMDDMLLVETDDVIVVAKKGESQRVKEVVNKLKKLGRREAVEHTTLYHAWGQTSIIGRGQGYLMKKVRVLPGRKLTLQMHYHRSEHWVVLRGTARVVRGDETMMIHEGESVFIPQTMKHQLANPGRIPLEIIEVQNGSYIGEDDIERYPDPEE